MADATPPPAASNEPTSVPANRIDPAKVGGGLALGAAALTLASGFLPLIEDTGSDQSFAFFDCGEVPGCAWLGLWLVGAAVTLIIGGGLAISGRSSGVGGTFLAAGGLGCLGFLGWAAFISQDAISDFGISLGPGPYVGVVGGLVGFAAGILLLATKTRAALKLEPAQPDEYRSEARTPLVAAGAFGVIGAVGIAVAAFLPYIQIPGGDDLSVADCGQAACAWFAIEPIALAGGLLVLSVMFVAGALRSRSAVAVLAVAGIWAVLLYGGYLGYATKSDVFGPNAGDGPAGWVGIAAGIVAIIGAFLMWRVRAQRPLEDADISPQRET